MIKKKKLKLKNDKFWQKYFSISTFFYILIRNLKYLLNNVNFKITNKYISTKLFKKFSLEDKHLKVTFFNGKNSCPRGVQQADFVEIKISTETCNL